MMSNRSQETAGPELLDVLRDETVREHMVRMFEIGTVDLHESAFAVYSEGDKNFAVSDLLVPDPSAVSAGGLDAVRLESSSVNVDELIKRDLKKPNSLPIEDILDFTNGMELDRLSPEAASKINAVITNPDVERDAKQRMVERIAELDLGVDYAQNQRDDIFLVAHNHPQPSGYRHGYEVTLHVDTILQPSSADIKMTAELAVDNPKLVEMIVAASDKERKAILYKLKNGRVPDVGRYGAEAASGSHKDMIGRLATSGFDHVIIDLSKQGKLTAPNQNRIRRFDQQD